LPQICSDHYLRPPAFRTGGDAVKQVDDGVHRNRQDANDSRRNTMPDYGHPLRFGTFISPANSPADRPVELAQLSERLGFDFVTFQDHPYKSDYLDTWTLLSWVAARTERIGVSGNVLNLPLRQPPAVLARAAASLDLLSGGRTSLGIGAGFFWDAVQAAGGRRLTPLQAVAALGEAIDVIRGVWDADAPGALSTDGEFYQVNGAERGPAPAHDIPIWLGAHKPKMQELVGRKANGWLPSLPVMEPGGLQRGNAIIDDSARTAGRDPRDITRLLNIFPGQQTPEELAQLALEDGASTFILAGDDPDVLERFAAETIPAVREHVARGRK
jgi:alkanesulfonate monooxygenase SsuD/methylene tetrahydromethanopterin reductase-like flavin-dependent oxidoreductase (luciferase family)